MAFGGNGNGRRKKSKKQPSNHPTGQDPLPVTTTPPATINHPPPLPTTNPTPPPATTNPLLPPATTNLPPPSRSTISLSNAFFLPPLSDQFHISSSNGGHLGSSFNFMSTPYVGSSMGIHNCQHSCSSSVPVRSSSALSTPSISGLRIGGPVTSVTPFSG